MVEIKAHQEARKKIKVERKKKIEEAITATKYIE